MQAVPPNVLAAFRWDMLRELQEKPHQRKGLGLSLEELILGSEGDHGGLSILLNAYLFQGERRAGDVLGEGFAGSNRKRWNADRMVQGKAGVLPVDGR
jgi:hypothetical protein